MPRFLPYKATWAESEELAVDGVNTMEELVEMINDDLHPYGFRQIDRDDVTLMQSNAIFYFYVVVKGYGMFGYLLGPLDT